MLISKNKANLFKMLIFTGLVFTLNTLTASVQDHFKPALNKGSGNSMRNIDFIYMINLDQRPEKWNKSLNQLQPYGITPYRFSAVNGWELTLDDVNDVGLKFTPGMQGGFMGTSYRLDGNWEPSHEVIQNHGQTYFVHCMARGTIGIVLSHLSILQDALDSGYETIWVMEDDIHVMDDPRILSDLVEKLDDRIGVNNWDVLFTDRDIRDSKGNYVPCTGAARRPDFCPRRPNNYTRSRTYGPNFRQVGARFGATSMIYRKSGMKKILNFIKEHKVFLPYDMDNYLPLGIKLFTVRKDVVTNLTDALSDNGGANYKNK